MSEQDPKQAKRIKDELAKKRFLLGHPECCVCGGRATNVHHILKRSQGGDDMSANFAALCGSGTTGCHGRVEARDQVVLRMLWEYIRERNDFFAYLVWKLDGLDKATEWCKRNLYST